MAGGAGTLSEVAHALQAGRTVILLGLDPGPTLDEYRGVQMLAADSPEQAVEFAARVLGEG
jgi:hypothetical protein